MPRLGVIYLLHFSRPYRHARHYMGWAENHRWLERLQQHERGQGARLLQVIKAAGITWVLARTWEGVDRHQERRFKNSGHLTRLCPICRKEQQHDRH